jgi:putative oxidoreductase
MSTLTQTLADWPRTRSSVLHWISATTDSPAQTLLRLTLGIVLLPHGAQHLFGAFGGSGLTATVEWMTSTLGIPAALAVVAVLVEFFGPLLLIAGVAARLVGLSLAIFMAVAGSTHVPNGFFMNWFGTMAAGAEGFEYHLLAIAIAVAIVMNGAGSYSVDQYFLRRRQTGR